MLLSELLTIKYGKNQSEVENQSGKYPIYGTSGIFSYADKYIYNKPSILIGRKGSIDKIQYVDSPFWCVDTAFYTEINEDIVIPKYLYYKLLNVNLKELDEGTTIPSLRTETLNKIKLNIDNTETQQHIVDSIGSVDDAIEKNEEIIDKLEAYADKYYDIYTNIDSDELLKLGDCANIATGKLNANASSENGQYKFFTCSHEDLKIDTYSFDCEAIILSGNGEIEVKYYKGKFDAYQRAYVLCPDKYFFLFLIELKRQINNLKSSSQGSVIKFITKGMIENITININNQSIKYNETISKIYHYTHNFKNQNEQYKNIKQLLLSKYFD